MLLLGSGVLYKEFSIFKENCTKVFVRCFILDVYECVLDFTIWWCENWVQILMYLQSLSYCVIILVVRREYA